MFTYTLICLRLLKKISTFTSKQKKNEMMLKSTATGERRYFANKIHQKFLSRTGMGSLHFVCRTKQQNGKSTGIFAALFFGQTKHMKFHPNFIHFHLKNVNLLKLTTKKILEKVVPAPGQGRSLKCQNKKSSKSIQFNLLTYRLLL